MNNYCIVVFIYKNELYDYEQLSLLRITDFVIKNNLIDHTYFVMPNSFNFNEFLDKYMTPFDINIGYNSVTFYDYCFASVNAYNNLLMLNRQFYEYFINNYDYIFTYQLDGYIFDNQFEYFMEHDFDYIGGYNLPMNCSLFSYKKYDNIDSEKHLLMNGGISLRKIKFCIETIENNYENIIQELYFDSTNSYLMEDVFFSMFYKQNVSAIDSIRFSLHYSAAETHYAINNFNYPFCCHGFNKSIFLQKLIKKYNEEHNLDYENFIIKT